MRKENLEKTGENNHLAILLRFDQDEKRGKEGAEKLGSDFSKNRRD